MADYRTEASLGARIQAARKARGIKSTRELADLVGNDTISVSILQNIESGRMTNVSAAQLLNIAFALKVAPSFLLAPMGAREGNPDLPGLSSGLASMQPNEFDAWLTGSDSGAYRPTDASEIAERSELAAYRDLDGLLREHRRLRVLRGLDSGEDRNNDGDWNRLDQRVAAIETQVAEIREYLARSGWTTDGPAD